MNQRYREFVMCIAQIEKNIEKIKAYEMKPYGLSGMDVTIFAQLSLKEEGYSVSELSKECEMDKAAISRSIKKMDEKGLVLYAKGYGSKITLTEEGKAIAKTLLDKIDMYIAKAEVKDLELRKQFYTALHAIASNIDELMEEFEND